jgi:phosphoenolpyruvate carboxykinase (ATP)
LTGKSIGLEKHGLVPRKRVHRNLPAPALVEHAIRREEGLLARSGALATTTGDRTGRSPDAKFLVDDAEVHDEIWWGEVNRPMLVETFERFHRRVTEYLADRELYVFDGFAGADPEYRLPVRVVTETAWHNLFAHQLFLRPGRAELAGHEAEFTILHAPNLEADPADGTGSGAYVLLDLSRGLILIGGTQYAGEIKKSIFSVMNWLMPHRAVLPMHCSANVGRDGDTALFFGLSGTGKTTLSADPERRLIGDDEHGWSTNGVFNFEGGCYAKCIRLSQEKEPEIWAAIRFGSVVENVVVDPATRTVDYDDDSITENTRVAYPVDFIPNAMIPGIGGHPRAILFLTADAFGVLPPLSQLTPEQAMYHFLSGYTARVAGTEAGVREPQATFSTCFGAPFMPRHPAVYAAMLRDRIAARGVRCWLVNTGWSGGAYGTGERISIAHTRALVHAALDRVLERVPMRPDPAFGLLVPEACPGVPKEVLQPRNAWRDKRAYDETAAEVARRFEANFVQFAGAVDERVRAAGIHAAA